MNKKYTDRQLKYNVIDGVKFYEQDSYHDFRGHYYTVYDKSIDSSNNYVRDKISISRKDTLRGIHGDFETTKLITCVYGEVYSVIVDNRKDSDTYNEWFWNIFSHTNRNIMILPPGVGLSYLILSEEATILYKWSYPNEYPDTDKQFTLKWNDEKLNIYWPIKNPLVQPRDM